jgi:hypothetical protein
MDCNRTRMTRLPATSRDDTDKDGFIDPCAADNLNGSILYYGIPKQTATATRLINGIPLFWLQDWIRYADR